MGKPDGTDTHKPNTLKRGENKFERDWERQEEKRRKRERQQNQTPRKEQ
jgi:hypothetical protein